MAAWARSTPALTPTAADRAGLYGPNCIPRYGPRNTWVPDARWYAGVGIGSATPPCFPMYSLALAADFVLSPAASIHPSRPSASPMVGVIRRATEPSSESAGDT